MKQYSFFLTIFSLFFVNACVSSKKCSVTVLVKSDEYDRFNREQYEFEGQSKVSTLSKIFGGVDIVSSSQQVIWDNCKDVDCMKAYWETVDAKFNLYFNSRYGLAFKMTTECGNQLISSIENGLLLSPDIGVNYLDANKKMRKFFFESARLDCFSRIECNSYSDEIHYFSLLGDKFLKNNKVSESAKQVYTSHFVKKIFCIQKKYFSRKLDNGSIDKDCFLQVSSEIRKQRIENLRVINSRINQIPVDFFNAIEKGAGVR